MSLKITGLRYLQFRNLRELLVEPSPDLTILIGPNAAGKTNCVEGVVLLTGGATFRHVGSLGDFVTLGCDEARLHADLAGDKRSLEVDCAIRPGKKAYRLNGKACASSSLSSLVPAVVFNPDDLLVVKGGSALRRGLLDGVGTQLEERYRRVLSDYTRALQQRNALLRDEVFSGDIYESWTSALVASGTMLSLYRAALLQRLRPYVEDAYASISATERLEVRYRSFHGTGLADRHELESLFAGRIAERREEERARRTTVVGPHRDDLDIEIDGRSSRLFASQGQQRSTVLALKIAHANIVRDYLGRYPVFLLDDVMSELDGTRRAQLLALIDSGMQTIVTTTNISYFTPQEVERAKVVRLGHDED